jgi:hypothetical protein
VCDLSRHFGLARIRGQAEPQLFDREAVFADRVKQHRELVQLRAGSGSRVDAPLLIRA